MKTKLIRNRSDELNGELNELMLTAVRKSGGGGGLQSIH